MSQRGSHQKSNMSKEKPIVARKTKTPTLEQRAQAAQAQASNALSVFQLAADQLEEAAKESLDVAQAAFDESTRLHQLGWSSADRADEQRKQAGKIRELLGLNTEAVPA